MGIDKFIKQGVSAARAMTAGIREAMPQADGSTTFGSAGEVPEPTILNPTRQPAVDRLLGGSGSVRAVVMGSSDDTSAGDRPVRTRVTVRLRPRLAGGGLGDELSPRFDEAGKRHAAWTNDFDLDGVTQLPALVKDLFSPSDPPPPPAGLPLTDPLMQPVNGVTWAQYIAVRAHIHVHSLTSGFDAVAEAYGVPAGQWAEAHSGWMARITSAPSLAAQWGWDLDRAQRALRGPGAPA